MKLHNRILVVFCLAGLILSGCQKDETPTATAKQLAKISDTWVITSAKLDGTNITTDYAGFNLTISGSANTDVFAYGAVGRPQMSPWPSGGTWAFGKDVVRELVRDPGTGDQLFMSYSVTDSQLIISFTYNGPGYSGARVSAVDGEWDFMFERKK